MSDVSRIPDSNNRTCVRRALFGPIDHEENRKFVKCELAKIEDEQRREWNFDFKNELPLEGRYQWSRIGNVQLTLRLPLTDVCSRKSSALKESPLHKHSPSDRNQTKITDYMRNRKHTVKPYSKRTPIPNSPKHNVRRTASS